MKSQTIKIVLVNDKGETQQVQLQPTSKGLRLKASVVPNGKFILSDAETGAAPKGLIVRRVGKDLLLYLEGDAPETSSVLLEDFFANNAQLVGLDENGFYQTFTASLEDAEASSVAALQDGESLAVSLNGPLIGNVHDTAAIGVLPWAAGSILGIGAGALGMSSKSSGRSADKDPKPVKSEAPVNPAQAIDTSVSPSTTPTIDATGDTTVMPDRESDVVDEEVN
ncbi:hypothetical protein, partial [Pseudomonas mosselii]|uniref:hypothetical protein n=1 Tax=Pseudomonas mosselii TaxID=78327 RepID=UPI003F329DD3